MFFFKFFKNYIHLFIRSFFIKNINIKYLKNIYNRTIFLKWSLKIFFIVIYYKKSLKNIFVNTLDIWPKINYQILFTLFTLFINSFVVSLSIKSYFLFYIQLCAHVYAKYSY